MSEISAHGKAQGACTLGAGSEKNPGCKQPGLSVLIESVEYLVAKSIEFPMPWTSLCDLEELKENEGKYVEIDGHQLAVFLSGGAVSVLDNRCPHAGGNLSAGPVQDGCAVCPWHYWAFRLDNGQLRDSPGVAVSAYKTRILEYKGRRVVQAELLGP